MRTKTIQRRSGWVGTAAATACLLLAVPGSASAHGRARFCSATADLQYSACAREIKDDQLTARAICLNLSDDDERAECFAEAQADYADAREECGAQHRARRELCRDIGEDRYDPSFDPEDFETEFGNINPYYPVAPGNRWVFESEEEHVTVRALAKTKLIEGVTCLVVNDVVDEDGLPTEDTNDWVAQRKDGTLFYCGEESKDLAYFDGDVPMEAELVEIEGSFKAGRDGAKPGTLFLGTPVVGAKYRQEWSPGDAEDVAEVLSTSYGYGSDDRFDELVPEDLVDAMCDDDCVVTADSSPLEPDVVELKFYARGVGVFMEVKPEDDVVLRIVECNTDPKCDAIPEP